MWSTLPAPIPLHFAQAKLAILAKKHVIIEKPAVDHPSEWKELIKLANEHQVYLFEAARNYQEAAFQVVKTSSLTREILAPTSPLPNILLNCRPFLQVDAQYFLRCLCRWSLDGSGSLLPLLGHWLLWRTDLQPLHRSAITQFG